MMSKYRDQEKIIKEEVRKLTSEMIIKLKNSKSEVERENIINEFSDDVFRKISGEMATFLLPMLRVL